MGLAPALVDQVFDIIQTINRQGTTILVVEQNATVALGIAHRGYVLQNGRIVVTDTARRSSARITSGAPISARPTSESPTERRGRRRPHELRAARAPIGQRREGTHS